MDQSGRVRPYTDGSGVATFDSTHKPSLVFVVYAQLGTGTVTGGNWAETTLSGEELAQFHAFNKTFTTTLSVSAKDAGYDINGNGVFTDSGDIAPQDHTAHIASASSSTADGAYAVDAVNAGNSDANEVVITFNPSTAVMGSSKLVDPMTTGTADWDGQKVCIGYVVVRCDGALDTGLHTNGAVSVSLNLSISRES